MSPLLVFLLACGSSQDPPAPTPTATGTPTGTTGTTPSTTADPTPPDGLTHWLTGEAADADVVPTGPGLILMGGGTDVDMAFEWWGPQLAGGDVVVLRTSGEDGYNDYLYSDIGGVDSVETLLVTSRTLADDPYVAWRVATAEGIFLAGGDQWTYYDNWRDTALADALSTAWDRGAILGGTSAGCAVLGEFVFTAQNGTVYSDEVLADPYDDYATLADDFRAFPPLADAITDTHFADRDRMGRLVGFVARVQADGWSTTPVGIGVDERTALVLDASGVGTVMGAGFVYLVRPTAPADTCQPGAPLEYVDVAVHRLDHGDTATFPGGDTAVAPSTVTASGGVLTPANPY